MTNLILDEEEQKLLAAFEADEFESVLTEGRKANLAKAAEAALKKRQAYQHQNIREGFSGSTTQSLAGRFALSDVGCQRVA